MIKKLWIKIFPFNAKPETLEPGCVVCHPKYVPAKLCEIKGEKARIMWTNREYRGRVFDKWVRTKDLKRI